MKDILGFKTEPGEEPYRPNRAQRRAADQARKAQRRRGQRAYNRALKTEQQVDKHLRAIGVDPDEATK